MKTRVLGPIRVQTPCRRLASLKYSDPMDPAVLKQQIDRGEYRVDAAAVADAIMRRVAQNACSYPASGPAASANTRPGGPCSTDPIQVTLLNWLALRAGRQTHSS